MLNAPSHNAAAVLASEQFRRILAEPAEPGRDRVVLLTGIPGAGKTSSVLENGVLPRHTHAVYEGQLATPDVAIAKVKQVLDAGLTPVIMVAHTTPERALENTLTRFSEIGRGASIGVMATIQGGLPAGLSAVRERYGDAVELRVMDRRNFADPKVLSGWDNLPILESEGNHERIKQRLTQHLEQQRGHLSESAYRQAAGLAPVADRRIDGGSAQQHETSVHRPDSPQRNQQTTGLIQPSTDRSTPSSQQMGVSLQKIDAFAASHGLKVGDAFYVKITKDQTVDEKRRLVNHSRKIFDETAAQHSGLTENQVKLLMLKNGIFAAKQIGQWKDRWVMHPLPTLSEAEKASCFLTDMGDNDEDHQAWLHNKASLHAVDSWFNRIRRRNSMLERPIVSAANRGRTYYAYSAYKPEQIAKLLTILRACHNYIWLPAELKKTDKKETPAMRLGLAKALLTYRDIVYFRK